MERVELKGNEIIVLDDPDARWLIERGSVALFGVPLQRGETDGPRRHLISCGVGELLIGFPAPVDAGGPVVIAVALEICALRRLPALEGPDLTGAQLLARWRRRWQDLVGDFDDQSALLRRIGDVLLQNDKESGARVAERERRSGEAAQEALTTLTSVLCPRRAAELQGGDLFSAASVVGQALGISIRRPASWEGERGEIDDVEAIARASRVRVRQVVLHDAWWQRDCGPLLGFVGEEKMPLALMPQANGAGYFICDPLTKTRSRVDNKVAALLAPEAYVFYRPLPKDATKARALFKFAFSGRGRDFLAILATATIATLLGMFTPQATAMLVDQAIPDADLSLLRQIGFGLLAAALGITLFRWSQGIAMLRVETAADAATQSAVWDRLLSLQVSFFRKFSSGDLQSRVTAVSQIRRYLGGTTLRTLFSSVIMLLNLLLLLYYSPPLTLLAIAVAILAGAVTIISGLMILRCMRLVLEIKGRFFGLMVQLINGVAKLRVAAAEERAFSRWAVEYSRLLKVELRQKKIQDAVRVINIALQAVGAIALFSVAAVLIQRSAGGTSLTTGLFLAFNVAFGTFIGAVINLSNTVTDVMAIAILRERAKPILEATPEVDEQNADPGRIAGRLQLEHVSFRYHEDGPLVLDDVSLQVEPSQFIALVGPSGSGKSTLIRLLLGFESPLSGRIYYDGQDLAGLDVYAIRRQLSVVLQNGRINAGSMFENIVTGTRLTLNEAWEAAHAAGFEEEIKAMPMGLHTVISEGGTNLSGGQRQRLLLTRALAHKPSVLLLDEATSALDNQTQAIVSESLRRLQVTRVVIAHRLSTVRNADRIYVIERGRVSEEGTFDELAARGGLFSKLMARQMT